uniref:Uncharacterized protein n=1 Tax=Arundo donax TaxID=35708 RepID=A0A0A9FMC9_ARUDO
MTMEEQGYFTSLLNEGNNNLPFEDFSSPPEEQPSPILDGTPSARPNQKRSKNFNEKEDTMLVSA